MDRVAPKRRFREGASLAFRRGVGGWRRAARSLRRAFHNYGHALAFVYKCHMVCSTLPSWMDFFTLTNVQV